jgi:PAS domain S-box-containing protein
LLGLSHLRIRILLLILLAVVPALLLSIWTAGKQRAQALRQVEDNALRLSRSIASNLDRDIEWARELLDSKARLLQQSPSNPCQTLLPIGDTLPHIFSNIGIADGNGRILCNRNPTDSAADLDDVKQFPESMGDPRFHAGYDLKRGLGDRITLVFIRSVRMEDPLGEGNLFLTFGLDWINQLAVTFDLPDGSAVSVSDRRGTTLIRYPNPEKWVGSALPDTQVHESLIPSREGVLEIPGVDGITRLYAFSKVKGGFLIVRTGMMRGEAYESANRLLLQNIALLTFVGLFALALAWVAGRTLLVNPILALIEATRKLTKGEWNARTGIPHGVGEFGQLARAFDEMAESLEWRDAQLRESDSERLQAEENLNELLVTSESPIVVVDEAGLIARFSPRAEEYFQFPAREVLGRKLDMLFPDAVQGGEMTGEWSRNVSGHVIWNARRKDGSEIPSRLMITKATRSGKITMTVSPHSSKGRP